MHAFEEIVSAMLEASGWWVMGDYRVALSKADKRELNNPSRPDGAIDLIAYQPGSKRLAVIECKAMAKGIETRSRFEGVHKGRFKLFTDLPFQRMILKRLHEQLTAAHLIAEDVRYELWLVARYIKPTARPALQELFDEEHEQPWVLHGQEWLAERLPLLLAKANPDDAAVYGFQIATELAERDRGIV